MQFEFFIPLRKIPTVTAQEQGTGVRGGKPYRYDPPELKAAKMLFRDHLARFAPPQRLTGPIELQVCWHFAPSDRHPEGTWKTTRPDTDNLIKLLKDEMTKTGFWIDDAQVCSEWNAKIFGHTSGISIMVRQMPERFRNVR